MIILCWISSHIGIQENHKADSIAKPAQDMEPDKNYKIPYTDLKLKINQIPTKNGNYYRTKISTTSSTK